MSARALALPSPAAPPAVDPTEALAQACEARADAYEALARAELAQAAALRASRTSSAPSSAPTRLHPPREAAAALSLSIATFNRRVNEGAIPFVQIGDSRRYDLEAVRAALANPSQPKRLAEAPEPDEAPVPAPSGVRRVSTGGKRGAR